MNKIMICLLGGVILAAGLFASRHAFACQVEDRVCVIEALRTSAEAIEKQSWRDQTYRELAKTLAFEGRIDEAMEVLGQINNPDTQALTVRGIGMAVAERKVSPAVYNDVFARLRSFSEGIDHPPSYAIALTYIAMAQAFAGDNDGAWATAADMENDALRHKAYGETAEIQAEQGDYKAAMKSISLIGSEAYRNKAYSITSKIFADDELFADSLGAAQKVTNPYKRAKALQYMLDKQKPRELARD